MSLPAETAGENEDWLIHRIKISDQLSMWWMVGLFLYLIAVFLVIQFLRIPSLSEDRMRRFSSILDAPLNRSSDLTQEETLESEKLTYMAHR